MREPARDGGRRAARRCPRGHALQPRRRCPAQAGHRRSGL